MMKFLLKLLLRDMHKVIKKITEYIQVEIAGQKYIGTIWELDSAFTDIQIQQLNIFENIHIFDIKTNRPKLFITNTSIGEAAI